MRLHGRQAYQGLKQVIAYENCKTFNTAVDVGAHVGLWSYNMAHMFKQVHAFEPVPEHRECFEANVKLSNVTLHSCALGATKGMVDMNIEQGSSGNTTIGGHGNIPMMLLDDFELSDVSLIKLDCEGYELNVLKGGAATIAKWLPTIVVEQKRDMSQRFGIPKLGAVQYLQDAFGYKVAKEISGDYIMVT